MLLDYQTRFVDHLFNSGALMLGKFQLKSGRVSPYFINAARIMSDGRGCWILSSALLYEMKGNGWLRRTNEYQLCIHGPAYKGIPIAATLAQHIYYTEGISVRWSYDRKEPKKHGDLSESSIVGHIHDKDRIVLVDDVTTTSDTKVDQWIMLKNRKQDLALLGVLVAVDRREQSTSDIAVLEHEGIRIRNVVTIDQVFSYLFKEQRITAEHYERFVEYFDKYGEK